MFSQLRPALVCFVVLTILTGLLYPLAVTGIAQVLFPRQANGSLIVHEGTIVGSSLIGQEFGAAGDPKYFWGRLSATAPVPFTSFNGDKAAGSSGSNLGPTNPALIDNARSRMKALNAADVAAGYARQANQPIPVDLVTASASGLDPHISLAAAQYQLPRVAKSRGLSEKRVGELVRRHTHSRQLGILGEPVVNVLELNLELDDPARP